jgi:hypothetical protein
MSKGGAKIIKRYERRHGNLASAVFRVDAAMTHLTPIDEFAIC